MRPEPLTRLEELEAENRQLREQFDALQWARMLERFSAVDAIKDDACPACGGRVRVVEETRFNPPAIRLEAVQ